jgi:putative N6-adenine-specific DNA methylase
MDFCALCPFGVEKLVRDEIKGLGWPVLASSPGRVDFSGPWESAYTLNLRSRVAERVLVRVGEFAAASFDELYEGTTALPWEDWITPRVTIRIEKARSFRSTLTSIPSIQGTVQKAMFDRLCRAWGLQRLPQTGPETALRVFLVRDRAELFLDTTGDALHNRGYRKKTGEAPLKENLAAALVLFSGWRRKFPFVDPFCGSGTLLTEALMFALDVPPGSHRSFAFENLVPFNRLDWNLVREEGRQAVDFGHRVRVVGSDKDGEVLQAARLNLAQLGFTDLVRLEAIPMEEASAERWGFTDPGFIVTNPPYGERLENLEAARALAQSMALWRERFPHWNVGVLSPLTDLPELLHRKAYVVRELSNGPIRVKFFQFQGE